MPIQKTCCVTDHRTIPAEKLDKVEAILRQEISQAIEDGYTRFISGFAQGIDLLFAFIVMELKKQRLDLFLEAAIPYQERFKTPDKLFQMLIGSCDDIKVICHTYTPSCFIQRNRYMVLQSARVIAVYDGREKGGTVSTRCYAHSQDREVRVIKILKTWNFLQNPVEPKKAPKFSDFARQSLSFPKILLIFCAKNQLIFVLFFDKMSLNLSSQSIDALN